MEPVADPDPGATTAIRSRGLGVRRGRDLVLRDVDLEVPAATVTAVIGPNGAGKSTLLDALAGLLSPATGRLEVLGRDPIARPRPRPPAVAYVLQSAEVDVDLPLTVGEVVTMARYAIRGVLGRLRAPDRAAVADALDRLAVADLADRSLSELSEGQRRRVYVAQGLAQQAPVLLLDEPLTGLDLVSRDLIADAIAAERSAGRTVVVTTHDLGDARRADHVVLLAGRVVAQGPPARVLQAGPLSEAYRGRVVRVDAETLLLDDAGHDHDHDAAPPGPGTGTGGR